MDSSGRLVATGTTSSSVDVTFSSLNTDLDKAFQALNGTVNDSSSTYSHEFSHVAKETDNLVDLRNDEGVSLGLNTGDTITIDGSKGGNAITQLAVQVGTDATTYQELADAVETAFEIINPTGVVGVEIDPTEGILVINGDAGVINEISNVDITTNGTAATFDGIFNNSAGNWDEHQAAQDYNQSTSITVYDSKGESHVVTITFTKNPVESTNKWTWEANVPSPDIITSGSTGDISFDSDGNLRTFSYDGGAKAFTFVPGGGGASPVIITFQPGDFGSINGLSQFGGSPNAIADSQNGYKSGELSSINIDSNGTITGVYTNGISQDLAKIVLATFNNPNGLIRLGDNMYNVSANSGQPIIGSAGTTIQSSIRSRFLEQSNVELAEEFTKMIIAQRGFQANARITTVSDRMLDEVVRLKQ
jgi:flagellar hook protein FlgE